MESPGTFLLTTVPAQGKLQPLAQEVFCIANEYICMCNEDPSQVLGSPLLFSLSPASCHFDLCGSGFEEGVPYLVWG